MPETPQVVRVECNIEWMVVEEDGYWIGTCDSLRLTLQADTYAELMEDIGLALDALLKELLETGDFDRFMLTHGWTIEEGLAVQEVGDRVSRFDVPYDVKRGQAHDPTRHVHQ